MSKVLVIEDDATFCRALARVLQNEDHDVVVACDGCEGVKRFRFHRPQVVVTDVMMERKGGIEAICEILSVAPGTRIIAMTGADSEWQDTLLSVSLHLGAAIALPKPFRASDLLTAVNRLLPN